MQSTARTGAWPPQGLSGWLYGYVDADLTQVALWLRFGEEWRPATAVEYDAFIVQRGGETRV